MDAVFSHSTLGGTVTHVNGLSPVHAEPHVLHSLPVSGLAAWRVHLARARGRAPDRAALTPYLTPCTGSRFISGVRVASRWNRKLAAEEQEGIPRTVPCACQASVHRMWLMPDPPA